MLAFDASSLTLYVSISQTFRIFVIPLYAAPVNLITVLKLEHNKAKEKYYIQSQNDLYQTNDFVRFFWPGGWLVVWLWQVVATLVCYVLAFICQPISWIEEFYMPQGWYGVSWR